VVKLLTDGRDRRIAAANVNAATSGADGEAAAAAAAAEQESARLAALEELARRSLVFDEALPKRLRFHPLGRWEPAQARAAGDHTLSLTVPDRPWRQTTTATGAAVGIGGRWGCWHRCCGGFGGRVGILQATNCRVDHHDHPDVLVVPRALLRRDRPVQPSYLGGRGRLRL
jgi:hypothetical protein